MNGEQIKIIQSDIVDRVQNITNDCRTFLWLRSVYPNDLANLDLHIGGGNLLIAMGSFSVTDYLAKINYCISRPSESLPTNAKKDNIYDPVAPDCFVYLVQNTQPPFQWGIEKLTRDELNEFWDDWRNKLIHFNVQRNIHSAISFLEAKDTKNPEGYNEFINHKRQQRPAFEKNDSGWSCYVDILNRDLDILAKSIADKILDTQELNLSILRKWLDSNLQ